jgi:hypothetical protein
MSVNDIKKKIVNLKIIYLSIFILLSMLAFTVVNNITNEHTQNQLNLKTQLLEKSYNTIINQFQNTAYITFLSMKRLPKQLSILPESTDKKDIAKLRNKIYQNNKPTYHKLKKLRIQDIKVFLADNTKVLSMRYPKLHSFKAKKEFQYLTLQSNKIKKSMHGYQLNRKFAAFNFSFPIDYENKHLGVVVISFNARAIVEAMMEQYGVTSNLFIKKAGLSNELINNKKLYKKSRFDDYLFDLEVLKALGDKTKKRT